MAAGMGGGLGLKGLFAGVNAEADADEGADADAADAADVVLGVFDSSGG